MDLAEEADEALLQIQELKRNDWLDLYTRAVTVELTVYNANDNLFAHIIMLFEMPSTGGILSIFFVEPFKVYGDSNTNGLTVLIAQLMAVVVFLYYLVILIRLFRKSKPRRDFFKSVVNILEVLHICLGVGVISLFFMKNTETSSAVKEVLDAKGRFNGLLISGCKIFS